MKRILVVDDSRMNCVVVKQALTTLYDVSIVNSGQAALDFLQNEKVDLILMDIEMPQMDGRETVKRIKENPEWAKIPVIFLTGKNDRESVMKVTALKPEGYLLKSMDSESIIKAIDDFFEKKKWTL